MKFEINPEPYWRPVLANRNYKKKVTKAYVVNSDWEGIKNDREDIQDE